MGGRGEKADGCAALSCSVVLRCDAHRCAVLQRCAWACGVRCAACGVGVVGDSRIDGGYFAHGGRTSGV